VRCSFRASSVTVLLNGDHAVHRQGELTDCLIARIDDGGSVVALVGDIVDGLNGY
jgi:hypothetical protein